MRMACGNDACLAGPPQTSILATVLSLAPFAGTFAAVSVLVARHVFPLLSRIQERSRADGGDHVLPPSAPAALRQCHAEQGARSWRRRAAASTFAATIGLSAVLAELILAEISDLVGTGARATALRFTVPTLLFLLVGLIPLLELQSIIVGAGWSFQRTAKGQVPRMSWALLFSAFSLWLGVFWSLGLAIPAGDETFVYARDEAVSFDSTGASMGTRAGHGWGARTNLSDLAGSRANGLSRACLERIGVIGISLMALLSGSASVSSPWHVLTDARAHRRRPVTEVVISRKQAGLDATTELLLAKRHRLRSLQHKAMGAGAAADHSPTSPGRAAGLMGKLVGSIRSIGSGGDADEIKALQMEISGLESMEARLSASLAALRDRRASHARDGTAAGVVLTLSSYVFSVYCVYRILATTMATFRRAYYPGASFSSSDPINRFLGLLARHWDPKLDQLAWARQISFLLSGVILAASASSVLQTLRLFTKWAPGLLLQARANLALLVGQITATYVISAAILLRGSLPKEASTAVGDALESALEPGFADRWFEGWFLLGSVATALGIWIGGRIGGGADRDWDDWDDYGGEETGEKRS